ncbi:uncharacterized protein LOC116845914 isoform X1 [Odontomachus brunneus]|uniref:uncharacterized protein LOC116845914 isoform X1 n=1 Tax=Odontomachus brunneus TaxID=486640 RepID=UPI0013F27F68|nr:uncharacterized protein LOC116845914 isoform X1 [Odontomachus brunneus]
MAVRVVRPSRVASFSFQKTRFATVFVVTRVHYARGNRLIAQPAYAITADNTKRQLDKTCSSVASDHRMRSIYGDYGNIDSKFRTTIDRLEPKMTRAKRLTMTNAIHLVSWNNPHACCMHIMYNVSAASTTVIPRMLYIAKYKMIM